MKHHIFPILAAALFSLTTACAKTDAANEESFPELPANADFTLWDAEPAKIWSEAYPIGNGRLGAMIFGGTQKERLQLNEITIWSGGKDNPWKKEAWKHLPEIREAVSKKDWRKAEDLVNRHMTEQGGYFPSYQTLGDLNFTFDMPKDASASDYKRALDISTGIQTTSFTVDGVKYEREFFASHPAKLIVGRLSSSKKGGLSFRVSLNRKHAAKTRPDGSNTLLMTGNTDYDNRKGSCDYAAMLKIVPETDGKVSTEGDTMTVSGATSVVMLFAVHTSYTPDWEANYRNHDDLYQTVKSRINLGEHSGIAAMRNEHSKDVKSLFRRLMFDFGNSPQEVRTMTTKQRLRRFYKNPDDTEFVALLAQYGRYLMIASSREDNPLPSNSQGIWGDGFDMPWKCDYKSNINYEMNYWPVNTANLGECFTPALNLNLSLIPSGRITAKEYFNAPGWTCAYTTNAWGWTAPGGSTPWGPFFSAGGWFCQMMFDHYAFNGDRNYLKKIYPAMKENCQFFLSALTKGPDGKLSMCPSTSPENGFHFEGNNGTVAWGGEMESSIIREVFRDTMFAARVLKDNDAAFLKQLNDAYANLRPIAIGRYGQIQEWGPDYDDPRDSHRHISQLFALGPGSQIDPVANQKLADGARTVLTHRGDAGTGWSKAWKIDLWARLHDGNHSFKLLHELMVPTDTEYTVMDGGGLYNNLFDAHPPFQIDGNFGALTGIIDMLVQSHNYIEEGTSRTYIIDILPALPDALPNGSAAGIRARGGFEVSLAWKDKQLTHLTILNPHGNRAEIRIKGVKKQTLERNKKLDLSF